MRKKEATEQRSEQHTSPPRQQSKEEEEEEEEGERQVLPVNGLILSADPNVITIQTTSSSEPLNIRSVTRDEAELHGDIKIQKVAHTRWVPQKKSPEQVHRSTNTPPGATLEASQPSPLGGSPQPQRYVDSRPPPVGQPQPAQVYTAHGQPIFKPIRY